MSIPSQAKKQFSGVCFDVYQREQEQFDGNFKTFEKCKRHDSVICLPVFGENIAMVREIQPGWKDRSTHMIGGNVDKGLDPLPTMKMELSEEGGITAKNIDFRRTYSLQGRYVYSKHLYVARDCLIDHEPNWDPGGEKIELLYVTFDEFLEYVFSAECTFYPFANELLRMDREGRIDEFKRFVFQSS